MKAISKWVALLWSALCLIGLLHGVINMSQHPSWSNPESASVGAVIGFTLGMGMWVIIWLAVAGPALVIFLVSGKKVSPESYESENPPPSPITTWGWSFTVIVIIILVACLYYAFAPDSKTIIAPSTASSPKQDESDKPFLTLTPEQKAEKLKQIAIEEKAKNEREASALGLRWLYDEFPEEMGRGIVKMATIRSLNEVQFAFPYQGSQRATLRLRLHPKYGKDVIFSVEKGQFLCGFRNCQVAIRFDNGKAQNFSAVEPADHSSNMLFIRAYDKFLPGARKAKKVYIEAQFYQQGVRVFEFDVSGLKW